MEKKTKDAREKIFQAGKELFAEKGFEPVSVRDITGAAGVNASMVSYYFGGKEGLYEAIFEGGFSSMLSFLTETERLLKMPPRERLVFIISKIVEIHTLHPELARLLHHEMLHPTRMYSEKLAKGISLLSSTFRMTFEEGIEKGEFRSDLNTFEMTYALASIVNYQFIFSGLLSKIMNNLGVKELKMENLLSMLMEGIQKR